MLVRCAFGTLDNNIHYLVEPVNVQAVQRNTATDTNVLVVGSDLLPLVQTHDAKEHVPERQNGGDTAREEDYESGDPVVHVEL